MVLPATIFSSASSSILSKVTKYALLLSSVNVPPLVLAYSAGTPRTPKVRTTTDMVAMIAILDEATNTRDCGMRFAQGSKSTRLKE
ncbi:hypothetical protein TNCT_125141 [Trichonephila clavata]|uniref:Uncharacterized protein n=1 Tax=Trichonephila clavata TaxID=2740835 RepID=A0A8X6GCT7_TRICU|nr:hypothetical protein TNCT_125141 [Trichonephila clavata]